MTPTYYTPEISEMHVGMICQHRDYPRNIKWETTICDEDLVLLAYASKEHESPEDLFSDNFRVKHLDREDIEGEGWEYNARMESSNSKVFYEDIFIIKESIQMHKLYINQDLTVKISRWRMASPNAPITSTIFHGTILNLTEFRKLMKQLGINKA